MNKNMTMAAMVAAFVFLTMGAPRAFADVTLDQTLYCDTTSTCSMTQPSSGLYWTVVADMDLKSSTTFDWTLSVTGNNGAAGFLQDFSGQYFFGGSQLTNLVWVQNPGNWAAPSASKAGNSGTCQGNTPGAFCGAVGSPPVGSTVALGSTTETFEITGNYTGTFLSNGAWHLQLAASNNSDGSGGNAFAISQDIGGTVPDGGMTLMLLGGALVGLETLRRRVRV